MPKPFPKEFREDVVRVARTSDAPVAQVAKDFGISESCLHRWLAVGYDGERYQALWIPGDSRPPAVTDVTLVVQPARAVTQRAVELAEAEAQRASAPGSGGATPAGGAQGGVVPATGSGDGASMGGNQAARVPTKPTKKRYFGSRELTADRYALDFKKISDEVIAHLVATPGVRLAVRLEIEASTPGGFDDARVRTVSENATQLKFDQSSFEEK